MGRRRGREETPTARLEKLDGGQGRTGFFMAAAWPLRVQPRTCPTPVQFQRATRLVAHSPSGEPSTSVQPGEDKLQHRMCKVEGSPDCPAKAGIKKPPQWAVRVDS